MSDAEFGLAYEAFLRLTAAQEMKYGGPLFGKFILSSVGGLFLTEDARTLAHRWEGLCQIRT